MLRLMVICDNCGAVGGSADTHMGRPPRAHVLRSELCQGLPAVRWRQGPGGADWCPVCWAVLKRARLRKVAGKLRKAAERLRGGDTV